MRMSALEKNIALLEKESECSVPGTTIQRIMMDTSLLKEYGVKQLTDRKSQLIWTAGIGMLTLGKVWGHGNTVSEAVADTRRILRAMKKERSHAGTHQRH